MIQFERPHYDDIDSDLITQVNHFLPLVTLTYLPTVDCVSTATHAHRVGVMHTLTI